MIVAPYFSAESHDRFLTEIFKSEQKEINEGEDDALYIYTGVVGTGKSTLAHHSLSVIEPKPDLRLIPLTRKQFADSMKLVKDMFNEGKRNLYIQFDEAEASSRRVMSKWNTDIMRLYQTNRVFQCIHLWCNPDVKTIDRSFIDTRIKGIFFTFTKETNRPRRYLFFPKRKLLDMIDDGLSLTHNNLRKNAKKYAYYIGWFRKYEGPIVDAYKQHKIDSSSDIVEDFHNSWSGIEEKKGLSLATVCKITGTSPQTVKNRLKSLEKKGLIEESDYKKISGQYSINDTTLELLRVIKYEKD